MPDREPNWSELSARAIHHLKELVRLDTSNPPGNERLVAEYVAGVLRDIDIEPTVVTKTERRDNVVGRLAGDGSEKPILLTSHADVVPAEAERWRYPPFSATDAEGCIWGRGTLDMKSGTALHLAAIEAIRQLELPLARDIIVAVVADEEEGMEKGSRFLADEHPDLVRAEYALGEFGGFSMMVMGRRVFPVQVAEKGICWLKATAHGEPGHASVPNFDSSVIRLSKAVARLARRLPVHLTAPAKDYLDGLCEALPPQGRMVMNLLRKERTAGLGLDLLLRAQPSVARPLLAALTNTVTPTMLASGQRINVMPSEATVRLDGRTLPGYGPGHLVGELKKIAPELDFEVVQAQPAVQASPHTPVFRALERAITRHSSDGVVVPMLLPGMTDAKSWSILGTKCYGFIPLLFPDDFPPFTELIHGHDERIPISSVEFGARVFYEALVDVAMAPAR